MSLETATHLHQLNPANPAGSDRLQQGDDHLRLLKRVLKATFPNITGPVEVNQDFLNTGIAKSLVPFGAITLFFGEAAPAGWAICAGQTLDKSDGSGKVTLPDLRGRVPVGATDDRPVGIKFGLESRKVTSEAGGAHAHSGTTAAAGSHDHGGTTGGRALTVDQMPAHTHDSRYGTLTTGDVDATNPTGAEIADWGTSRTFATTSTGSGSAHDHGITAAGDHTHGLTIEQVPAHTHDTTVEVIQPSLAIHFIMKI